MDLTWHLQFAHISTLHSFSLGKFGRLGLGNERNCHSPKIVEHLRGTNPKQISCGGFHSAVITEDGKLYTFGGGEHGQVCVCFL